MTKNGVGLEGLLQPYLGVCVQGLCFITPSSAPQQGLVHSKSKVHLTLRQGLHGYLTSWTPAPQHGLHMGTAGTARAQHGHSLAQHQHSTGTAWAQPGQSMGTAWAQHSTGTAQASTGTAQAQLRHSTGTAWAQHGRSTGTAQAQHSASTAQQGSEFCFQA